MKFSKFAEYLKKLEETPKRLEITAILTDLIKDLDSNEADKGIYLSLGYLRAPFESLKFNIADKMMVKILENAYTTKVGDETLKNINELYAETGDLGDVAHELSPKTAKNGTELLDVYKSMENIAKAEGAGSQDLKITLTGNLLKKLDPLSAKYCVRIILGTTRLGFTELTVVDALSNFVAGNKELKKTIEEKYNRHPDIGLITKLIKENGIKGIEKISLETGVPVLSQKAQRLNGGIEQVMEKMEEVWTEYKFDGTRVQLHLDKNKLSTGTDSEQGALIKNKEDFLVKTFTRNLEETTYQYPDIVEAAKKQIKAKSAVIDGEAIGFNKETGEFLAFQETIQRKRKYNIEEAVKNIPLKYCVFDLLYLDGEPLIDLPLKERKKKLKQIIGNGDVIIVDDHRIAKTTKDIREHFDEAVEKNLEGLIAKNYKDNYQAGARSFSWVKLKRADEKLLDDTVDCTVLGYYFGKGERSKFGIGGFLAGVYDPKNDTFKTVTKVGTGLKDDDFIKLKEMADKVKVNKKPGNVEIDKVYKPDVYLKPEIVVEIGADEISSSPTHSTGYALRFPRLIKFREDKSPTESTNVEEIKKMFEAQAVKKAK